MISYSATWGNLGLELPPHTFVKNEVTMMQLAEELGFDAAWSAEHHFDANYCACPDNAMLDHLSGGRLLVGFGRGLAKLEYAGFGIDMGTSRGRFDEAAE